MKSKRAVKMALPRVVLADDMPQIRESIAQLLRHDFDIVGSAENGEAALEAATVLDPDLLVLDISMPGLSGLQVAALLRQLGCNSKIIFLTIHEDQDYVDAAFSVGALGYVVKSRVATDLIPAIQHVLMGRRFTSPVRQRQLSLRTS